MGEMRSPQPDPRGWAYTETAPEKVQNADFDGVSMFTIRAGLYSCYEWSLQRCNTGIIQYIQDFKAFCGRLHCFVLKIFIIIVQ